MHILIAIAGILGAGAFWWYRVQYMGKAAGEVADAIGHVRGNMRRNALRKKSALSPITAIDDPVVAAATVILAINTEDGPLDEDQEARLREQVEGIAPSAQKADEALVYAKWASDQVADVHIVIDKCAVFLKDFLSEDEKEGLVGVVEAVSLPGQRRAMFARRVELLRRKLGLVVQN
jgi:hypothetical protein